MMAGIQTQMPGHQFEQRGTARDHHDVVHWEWAMCGPDGIEVLTGIDTASVRDGRIVSLYGFFDA
jgi:formylmethanofuran dehydrogenase subunit E